MGPRPNIEKEEFINAYRFVRLPKAWAGEAFTKAYLEIYFLMKDKDLGRMRLYRTSYKVPVTTAFLKFAWESINLSGRKLEIENIHKLTEAMVAWEDDNKKVVTNIVKEFETDFDQVMDEILELQYEAKERGWEIVC